MIFSTGTLNARSEAMTICFLTVSSVPGGRSVINESVRVTRSRCSASMPAASNTLSKSTLPPGASGGAVLKTSSAGAGGAEVGTERFVGAVEQQPAQLTLRVESRRTGVATGGVDSREEVDRDRAQFRIDVAGRLVRTDRVELRLRRVELTGAGVLGQHAADGG